MTSQKLRVHIFDHDEEMRLQILEELQRATPVPPAMIAPTAYVECWWHSAALPEPNDMLPVPVDIAIVDLSLIPDDLAVTKFITRMTQANRLYPVTFLLIGDDWALQSTRTKYAPFGIEHGCTRGDWKRFHAMLEKIRVKLLG